MPIALACLAILLASRVRAEVNPKNPPDPYVGKTAMHGHAFEEFRGFWEKWPQVTVRYREDTKEMRYTYANDAAYAALAAGGKKYPDGAVFGKIGVMTDHDPKFFSSRVPSSTVRYQIMMRDAKKFAATDGWGYLIFDGEGKTMAGEPSGVSQACAACHRVVADTGFVFSQKMELVPLAQKMKAAIPAPAANEGTGPVSFKTEGRTILSAGMRGILPAKFTKISSMTGAMRQHQFQGTLHEVRPELIRESILRKRPAALISENGKFFSIVWQDSEAEVECGPGTLKFRGFKSITPTVYQLAPEETLFLLDSFCVSADAAKKPR